MNNDLEQFSEERLKYMLETNEWWPPTLEESHALVRIALAAKQAKPVAQVYQPANIGICAALGPAIRMINVGLPAGTLLYTTPQPVRTEQDDTRRMDWLVSKHTAVRTPLPYGSHEMFVAQCDSDDHEEYHTTLREQIDKAMLAAAHKPESE